MIISSDFSASFALISRFFAVASPHLSSPLVNRLPWLPRNHCCRSSLQVECFRLKMVKGGVTGHPPGIINGGHVLPGVTPVLPSVRGLKGRLSVHSLLPLPPFPSVSFSPSFSVLLAFFFSSKFYFPPLHPSSAAADARLCRSHKRQQHLEMLTSRAWEDGCRVGGWRRPPAHACMMRRRPTRARLSRGCRLRGASRSGNRPALPES